MMQQVESQTYEEALERLRTVVEKLERGTLPLEESLSLFEEGMQLSELCDQKLREVETRVQVLIGERAPQQVRKDLDLEFVPVDEEKDGDHSAV